MRKIALVFIEFYQKISFIWPPKCRYTPTCSQYAKEAFLHHPFLKALLLSFCRVLRCNPLAKGGFDPLK